MKTKTLITALFVFTLMVNTNTFSQVYHPFLNHSSWLTIGGTGCCEPAVEKTIEQGTTEVIGGKTYTKFIDPWSVYGAPEVYLREDITERKVYRLVDGADVVLYDFNLKNLDTFLTEGDTFTAAIDSINVNGGIRKRITLKSTQQHCGQPLTQVWIEGVGTLSHPLYPGWNMLGAVCSSQGGFFINTVCGFQNGIHIYGNPNCSPEVYHPFLNNSSWIISQTGCKALPDATIEPGTDKKIGSTTYKKFIDPYTNNPVYLRENISEARVYKLVDSTEVTLYDFSLKDGVTIGQNGTDFTAKVDSIPVNGGLRKRITLKSPESALFCNKSVTQVWIEGVGSTAHPFNPGYNMTVQACGDHDDIQVFLKCSFQNGIHIYGNSDCSSLLSVEDFSSQSDIVRLFPNPANDIVQIQLQNSSNTLNNITIYDMLGKVVQKVSGIATNQSSFSVGSLTKGIYLVEITTDNKIKTTRRLIVN